MPQGTMLISVVFLYIAASVSTTLIASSTIPALCPDRCHCDGAYPSTTLIVDCQGRPDVDVDQLTEQLDSLLSSNLTYGRLTSLSIVNTPLTHVPRSVCRLTTLTRLHLDYNRFAQLPNNCFANISGLEELTADRNQIAELQDGLFDGLRNLTTLSLRENTIKSIGLAVFNSSAMLTSLTRADLWYNKLTTLEPWPYLVGLNGKPDQRAIVDLGANYIRNFTNIMGLQLKCGMPFMSVKVDLYHNNIVHISDVLKGWNVNLTTYMCLSPIRNAHSTSQFLLRHNVLNCDCTDFDIIRIVHPHQHFYLFNEIYCGMPNELWMRRLNSVPLMEFVCELTERCPPGCRCVHRPANATLHVYCSNSNLTVLPLELPALPKSYTKYKLDFSNNRLLRRLERRAYFGNASIVDASNCGIETVDNWKQLLTVKHVYLRENRLTSIPRSVINFNMSTEDLSLHNNPWRCDCDDKWMSKWLNRSSHILSNTDVTCAYPQRLVDRNVLHISVEEFCIDPVTKALAVGMSSAAGVVCFLMSVGLVVYRLRVRLYTRWKFHPFDRDECTGEDMDYDVFLCCSSEDHDPYASRVLQVLQDRGFRVCYHYTDFTPGALILHNIEVSITRSKRTVCLLTENFVRSAMCLFEFETALHHWISNKRTKRLILLMALHSPNDLYANDASDTAALRRYVRQYTYIDYTADDWLDKLLYALPSFGLLQQSQNDSGDVQLLRDIQPIATNSEDDVPLNVT